MSSATCRAMGRASVLMRMISSWISGGWLTSSSARCVLVISSAFSSSVCATCCFSAAGSTVLASDRLVKVNESAASMMAPANASPNDSPNEPAAEFTPAASLTRSSEIGDSV